MADVVAVSARDLTPELWRTWEQLRQTNPQLQSPHFSSRFLQHVAAVREGVEVGPGGEPYKQSFRSGGIPLAEGSVAVNPLLQLVRTAELRARAWFRLSPLPEPVRALADRLRLARVSPRTSPRIPTQGG